MTFVLTNSFVSHFSFHKQLPQTITRILLNHFKWDKERLYERYYDGDQAQLFRDAHIVNPNCNNIKVTDFFDL